MPCLLYNKEPLKDDLGIETCPALLNLPADLLTKSTSLTEMRTGDLNLLAPCHVLPIAMSSLLSRGTIVVQMLKVLYVTLKP
jgi:hypothetical protein